MDWNKTDFDSKCKLLGEKGEKFVYEKLVNKFPEPKFLILDIHSFCEMDFLIIDQIKKEIIEIYEAKTTTKDKKEFSAGSYLQLAILNLQQIKKSEYLSFIPCYLYVLRVDNNYWKTGEFSVFSQNI